ncbi:MAG TPA: hypothetical protein VHP38_06015 [Ruminiclostridium sp.]|nr:hypothetical protein [Ruminiclostridium sp.]
MAWIKANCREGRDPNTEEVKHSKEQKVKA